MSGVDDILVDRAHGRAIVSINRPERRNSLPVDTAYRLHDALMALHGDLDTRVVVLRGVGSDFCVGADIRDTDATEAANPRDRRLDDKIFDIANLLHTMRPVTVAAIRGGCGGAGAGLALACDLRVAADDMRFNTAFLTVGVAGDMGVPWFLPRIVGAGRARHLSFVPRKVTADEAAAIGLVNVACPVEAFEGELQAVIDQLLNAAPLALAACKANYLAAEQTPLATFLTLEGARMANLFPTEDRQEAFRAFVEKRPPRFVGR
jgi:2-(1,2-epoxy-1,2-dihydrophenyl)acetyl-CoA isomerase